MPSKKGASPKAQQNYVYVSSPQRLPNVPTSFTFTFHASARPSDGTALPAHAIARAALWAVWAAFTTVCALSLVAAVIA